MLLKAFSFGFPGLSCLSESSPAHVDPNDLVRQSSGGSILTHSCSWKGGCAINVLEKEGGRAAAGRLRAEGCYVMTPGERLRGRIPQGSCLDLQKELGGSKFRERLGICKMGSLQSSQEQGGGAQAAETALDG